MMLGRMIRKSMLKNLQATLWSVIVLGASAALIVMFATISIEVTAKMDSTLRQMGANAVAYPRAAGPSTTLARAGSSSAVTWARLQRLTSASDTDITVLHARVGTVKGAPVVVVAADRQALARMTPYWLVSGRRAVREGEALLGRKVATLYHLRRGSQVIVDWRTGQPDSELIVVGIFESGDDDENRIFLTGFPKTSVQPGQRTADFLRRLPPGHQLLAGMKPGARVNCLRCHVNGPPGSANLPVSTVRSGPAPAADFSVMTYALLSVANDEKGIARLQKLIKKVNAQIQIEPLRQVVHGEQTVLQKVNLLTGLTLIAVLALTSLGVAAAVMARVVERRKEFALMQALGAKRRGVVAFLLAENALLGTIASVVGFLIGTLLAEATVHRLFGVSVTPRLAAFLAGFAGSMVVSISVGFAGSLRALRLPPAIALRGE